MGNSNRTWAGNLRLFVVKVVIPLRDAQVWDGWQVQTSTTWRVKHLRNIFWKAPTFHWAPRRPASEKQFRWSSRAEIPDAFPTDSVQQCHTQVGASNSDRKKSSAPRVIPAWRNVCYIPRCCFGVQLREFAFSNCISHLNILGFLTSLNWIGSVRFVP